jgi:hypothetical protein
MLISLSTNLNNLDSNIHRQKSTNIEDGDDIPSTNNDFLDYELPSYLLSKFPSVTKTGSLNLHISAIMIAATLKGSSQDKSKSKRPSVINNGRLIEQENPVQEELDNKIKGKTLEIYYYMNQINSEVGVREITREFGYSSPALAAYHLNRLVDFEIAMKTENNRYSLTNNDFRIGKLSNHIKVGNLWISQISIFTMILALFSIVGLSYFMLNINQKIWAITFIPLFIGSFLGTLKMKKNVSIG